MVARNADTVSDISASSVKQTIVDSRRVARRISAKLAGFSLSIDEWLILDTLERKQGRTMAELASETVLPASSITRFVDKLASSALIYRRANPVDRRQFFVYLSERGQELVHRVSVGMDEDV